MDIATESSKKEQLEKCFFPVEFEQLTHVKPREKTNGLISGNIIDDKRSESEKYISAVRKEDRKLLGIKKRKLYGNRFHLSTNEQVFETARRFLMDCSLAHLRFEPKILCAAINKTYSSFHCGIQGGSVKQFLELLYKSGFKWSDTRLGDIHQKFRQYYVADSAKFDDFLKTELCDKNLCVLAVNGYDLECHARLEVGITQDHNESDIKFTHITSYSHMDDWFPFDISFQTALITYLETKYILEMTALHSESFVPLVIQIEDIHTDPKRLKNDKALLQKGKEIYKNATNYISSNKCYSYALLSRYFSEGKLISRIYMEESPYWKKLEKHFEPDFKWNTKHRRILDYCLLDNEEREKRVRVAEDILEGIVELLTTPEDKYEKA
jgi:hypothetical protein